MKYVDNMPSRRNKRFIRLIARWHTVKTDNREDIIRGKRRKCLQFVSKSKQLRHQTLNPMPF